MGNRTGERWMSPAQSPGDTLAQILIEVAVISERLKVVPDHEKRIRKLERFCFALAGAAMPGSAAAGTWIGIMMTHR
jgi:hypothetical protein